MKLTAKTRPWLSRMIFIGMIGGTLVWSIVEILFHNVGIPLNLTIGPIGFDLYVISFWLRINPGTLLGGASAWILFLKIA